MGPTKLKVIPVRKDLIFALLCWLDNRGIGVGERKMVNKLTMNLGKRSSSSSSVAKKVTP